MRKENKNLLKKISVVLSFLLIFLTTKVNLVTASSEDPSNAYLQSVIINGHRLSISSWETNYSLDLPTNTTKELLSVVAEPENKKSLISVEGNSLVGNSTLVKIIVVSENKFVTRTYYINVQLKETFLQEDFIDVKTADYHSLALKSDGTLYGFGENSFGQLGDGTKQNRTKPVQVKNISGVIDFDTSRSHSIAVTNDGSVWAWGLNDNGQLSTQNTSDILAPTKVSGLSNIVKVSAGNRFNLALDKYGAVWFFGYNAKGQFDDEIDISNFKPNKITELSDYRIIDIAAGDFHSLVLTEDGTVYAWGANDFGQLGINNNVNKYSPVQIEELSNITYINANGNSSSAVRKDGRALFWGKSDFLENQKMPMEFTDISNVLKIDANSNHIVAMKIDGSVYSMGNNEEGQLASGGYSGSDYFSRINDISKAREIATGPYNSFIVGEDGYIYGAGKNHIGQIGIGDTSIRYSSLKKISSLNITDLYMVYPSHNPGEIERYKEVRLFTDTVNAMIYYTLDGTNPTEKSQLYYSPIPIEKYTVIKAIAVKDGKYSPVSSFEYLVSDSAKTEMNVNIRTKTVQAGNTVEIPITFTNIPSTGISNFKFAIKYNPKIMQFEELSIGGIIEKNDDLSYSDSDGVITLSFDSFSNTERVITSNGTLASLKFYVKYGVDAGEYTLSQVYTVNEGVFTNRYKEVNTYYNNGYIDVLSDSVNYGDVDGDNQVTALDLQYVQRYIAGKISSFPESDGFEAADINKDGSLSSSDVELIKRIILSN